MSPEVYHASPSPAWGALGPEVFDAVVPWLFGGWLALVVFFIWYANRAADELADLAGDVTVELLQAWKDRR